MQEGKIQQDRGRTETEEKQEKNRTKEKAENERNRREDKERLKQLIHKIKEDVRRMKEALFKRCQKRANKLAADMVDIEKKTQNSILEVNNNIKIVEEMQYQRMSEAKDSQATTDRISRV